MRKAAKTGSRDRPASETLCLAAGWDFVFADLAALFCDFMVELSVGSWGGAIVAPAIRRALLQGRNRPLETPPKTNSNYCF